MPTIGELAQHIRSKNAGPFWVTIDIFCPDEESFNRIKDSPSLQKDYISKLYQVDKEAIKIFPLPELRTIKLSFPRPKVQGHRFERDMHSGQQYIQIADAPI